MFENHIKGTHKYASCYTNMYQSQNRDTLQAMISQNREIMDMFIEYMMNKNKYSKNCDSLIAEFVREKSNMRSNSPEPGYDCLFVIHSGDFRDEEPENKGQKLKHSDRRSSVRTAYIDDNFKDKEE